MKHILLRNNCGFKMKCSYFKTRHLIFFVLVFSSLLLCEGEVYAESPYQWEIKWIKELSLDGVSNQEILSLTTGNVNDAPGADVLVGTNLNYIAVLNGFNGETLWYNEMDSRVQSVITADVNQDGVDEIFIGTRSYVYALDGRSGDILWSSGGNGATKLLYTDVQGHGDVLVGCGGSHIFVMDVDDGERLWYQRIDVPDTLDIALGDLNRDGIVDVVGVAAANQGTRGKVSAFQCSDGELLWTYELPVNVYGSIVAAGDVDGDSSPEVAVGAENNKLYVLRGDGAEVLWSKVSVYNEYSDVLIFDLEGDGTTEVVGLADDVGVYAGDSGSEIFVSWSLNKPLRVELIREGPRTDLVVGHYGGALSVRNASNGSTLWEYAPELPFDESPEMGVGTLENEEAVVLVQGVSGNVLVYEFMGNESLSIPETEPEPESPAGDIITPPQGDPQPVEDESPSETPPPSPDTEAPSTGTDTTTEETSKADDAETVSGPLSFLGFFYSLSIADAARLITIVGALVGVVGWVTRSRRERRKRMLLFEKMMKGIDDVYSRFKMNARLCEAELFKLRDQLLNEFKQGTLDEANYDMLDRRIGEYLDEIRDEIDTGGPE